MSPAAPPGWYVIRCVLFGGMQMKFLSKLAREKGIWTFHFNGSRLTVGDHTRARAKVAEFRENEEITILVEAARADEIVAFCCDQLHLADPGRGILYVTRADRAAPFVMPVG